MHIWEPYTQRAMRTRFHDSSCCNEYDLMSEGGAFFVLRKAEDGTVEETARGPYGRAVTAWLELGAVHQHKAACDR